MEPVKLLSERARTIKSFQLLIFDETLPSSKLLDTLKTRRLAQFVNNSEGMVPLILFPCISNTIIFFILAKDAGKLPNN
jgi:hypothetical protein